MFAAMARDLRRRAGRDLRPETRGNPLIAGLADRQAAGNMEGKEVRFGIGNSALWAVATTAASNGSVNAMHDSFTPLGMVARCSRSSSARWCSAASASASTGMLLFVILTVFLAGLMVGRTPEYLGKKIEAREVKLAAPRLPHHADRHPGLRRARALVPAGRWRPSRMPGRTASARCSTPTPRRPATTARPSPASPPTCRCHNTLLGLAMLLGRFGCSSRSWRSPARSRPRRLAPPSSGTFPTHAPLFVTLLVASILDRRRAHLPPRARAGPDRRAGRDGRRADLLRIMPMTNDIPNSACSTAMSCVPALARGRRASSIRA